MSENYIRDEAYLGVPEDESIVIIWINCLDEKLYVECGWVRRNDDGEQRKGIRQFIGHENPLFNMRKVSAIFETAHISGQG
jgi:transcriptional regulator of heat shock response